MQVEQYVMAYGIEQDRIRAIIPEGFVSLRPVLRINAEIQDDSNGYLEFKTPELKKPETIAENKEFCDCTFQWKFTEKDAHGVSIGKPFQPIHKSRKRPIPEIHLQQKMQQKFHADRCWEHIKLFLKDSKVKITKKQS